MKWHLKMRARGGGSARVWAPYLLGILCFAIPGRGLASLRDLIVIRADGVAVSFQVEIADTDATRAQGLMHRASLDARSGMLFDFGRETRIRMWMKNTAIPLDMLFVGADGDIRYIAAATVPYSESLIVAPEPARFVLEINAREARRFGLEVGDRLLLPR